MWVSLLFSLTDITDYLHYCGRDLCRSVLCLPVWHGALCVQEHQWEITAASCDARGQKTALQGLIYLFLRLNHK